ncbi:cation:proton antiporter [Reichenbachiella carrageenanivorans]|uniref:Cation:proton antiporter n=1 Tax=Reichenbachiella carrageenanivorans TaxID=2979869 RepID=A0ABY6CW65_9BACT|nr:cation:proton antiporter [Reichenbachiella carrageenanivorans]UXX78156.1 cation:proton antiporter [Reichenbachiella carrageenanivorans]
MTTTIIIVFCSLLLIAYLFNLTSKRTKIPSVILLLVLGWAIKQGTDFLEVKVPNLSAILPVLATAGLILIVLEGSLELRLNRSKISLIKQSFVGALLPMIGMSFLLAYLFSSISHFPFLQCLTNTIPLCIISSAIAVPSVSNLSEFNKEFVIYESSLSDILGVLLFNFVLLYDKVGMASFGHFSIQLIAIVFLSFVATIGLSLLISRIDHHVKFIPIILLVILIYTVLKIYHLPALIFILIFGLFIGNVERLRWFAWIDKFHVEELEKESEKFKDLTIELAFLVRALFFILFGFLLETPDILNIQTLAWSAGIVALFFGVRSIQLWLSGLPFKPLLFVAPRGLITILLFMSIAPSLKIPFVNNSLIIQIILLTAVVMTVGLMTSKSEDKEDIEDEGEENIVKIDEQDIEEEY